MKIPSPLKLIASLLICQLAGGIGSIFTSNSISSWYPTLIKPSFNPPNWLFAPVWTLLFILMGISLYLIWINKNSHKKTAYTLFAIQLVLNIFWSIFFFGLQSPLVALIEIIILETFIILSFLSFRKISHPAAYLLIPYLVWVAFATILNFAIVYLNY